jgi:oligopeptide/dipeptide ABC transporter ATP-binding protein
MSLLDLVRVRKHFPLGAKDSVLASLARRGPRARSMLHAVDDISFSIAVGESVGLVGESGCGKSTLVRLITRMLDATDGDIVFNGRNIGFIPASRFARSNVRPQIQMVFQDPTDSLNPRFTAFDTIADPLRRLANVGDATELDRRVSEAAEQVGLPPELLGRYPHQLSGGQKARVGIARAIVLKPQLLVLDEPTAALDVSVQATILKLLAALRQRLGMSYLFVSHDLNVVRMLCDRVLVMYLGKIVEEGPTELLFSAPAHPYTRALVGAIPMIGSAPGSRQVLAGEPRSPVDPAPEVCRFFGRCPRQEDRCQSQAPVLRGLGDGRTVACHFALDGPDRQR